MCCGAAFARTPPIALDSREGMWIGAGDVFIHHARDRWSVFSAPDVVNEIAVDGQTIWVATDDGVVRFESGSRRASSLSMDDGLPSQAVRAVAVDPQFVWFATNKGLARYRKLDRTIDVYTASDGLPHRAVNDIALVGRQVWFATRGGLAVYDPDTDGIRGYTSKDGLGSDYVAELYPVGDDLWCRTDAGLTRLTPATRRFTSFGFAEIGGEQIRAFVPAGDKIWIGTEQGLSSFETTSDAFIPFPQQGALESSAVTGIEPFTDYLFIATDKEIIQYHKDNRTFRRFLEADALAREAGSIGTVLAGQFLDLVFDDGVEVYDIQRDIWMWRTLAVTESAERNQGGATWQLTTTIDAETPMTLPVGSAGFALSDERFATALGGAGVGYQLSADRSIDIYAGLDYGEVELPGIRDVDIKAEYLGGESDVVREVRLGDALALESLEEGVERPLAIAGTHVRLASPGDEPASSGTVDVGVRRGVAAREFLLGYQPLYELQNKYILPGSERVYLDGELLTADRDYTIIYKAGQLAFLDPERVDDLSVVEIEYEFDMLPRKGLGTISLLDLLPGDGEIGAWVRSGQPTLISEESGLYAQIDGAAPRYIDRGWARSVFSEYRQGSRTIRVAIHDMGDVTHATDIYDYDLPAAREPVAELDNVVLDIGLATSYAIKAVIENYYVELAIDEKSDVTKQSIKLFALQILDREAAAGAYGIDLPLELVTAVRGAYSPIPGLEIGARAVETTGLPHPSLRGRQQLNSFLDTRYQREVKGGGRFTAYLEAAASQDQNSEGRPGFAGTGKLRLSHPNLEGSLAVKHLDPGYAPIGTKSTQFRDLRDPTQAPLRWDLRESVRFSGTAYPVRWLPTTVFFSRQHSDVTDSLAPSGDAKGIVQHAIGRVQLAHPSLPTSSVQVGHSMLDDGRGRHIDRLKLVGRSDYDLAAGILEPLGLRRFTLAGLYGVTFANTFREAASATAQREDRAEVARAEAKLAPTATETAYGNFRWRRAVGRADTAEAFALADEHWELNAGARSAFIPGLIPQYNHSIIVDARGDAEASVRKASSVLSPQVGIYPGDWWSVLAPVAMITRYSLSHEDAAEGPRRTVASQTHRIDNRLSYNGMGMLKVELQELYEVATTGADLRPNSVRMELRNRLILRPAHTSPITLRCDVVDKRTLNDGTLVATAPRWGRKLSYESGVEWLMRWTHELATQVKGTYTLGETRHVVAPTAGLQSFVQHRVEGILEGRYLLQGESSTLYLVERNTFFRDIPAGTGAMEDWGYEISLGVIFSLADNIRLDSQITYRETLCLADPCTPTRALEPRLLLSATL